MTINLSFAALLAFVTASMHFAGLVGLSAAMRRRGVHPVNFNTLAGQATSILLVVFAFMALHASEIWLYALAYL